MVTLCLIDHFETKKARKNFSCRRRKLRNHQGRCFNFAKKKCNKLQKWNYDFISTRIFFIQHQLQKNLSLMILLGFQQNEIFISEIFGSQFALQYHRNMILDSADNAMSTRSITFSFWTDWEINSTMKDKNPIEEHNICLELHFMSWRFHGDANQWHHKVKMYFYQKHQLFKKLSNSSLT